MKKIAIIGNGEHAYHLKDVIEEDSKFVFGGFIGIDNKEENDYLENQIDKIKSDGIDCLAIGIGLMPGNSLQIKNIVTNFIKNNFIFPNIIHYSAVVSPSAKLGQGVVVLENAVIKSMANIGDFCIINTSSVVSHNCNIGEYNHVSLGAKMGGNVRIEHNNFLGINCSLKQGIIIGSNVIIGAGAVVIDNIESNVTLIGNPAKIK